VKVRDVGVMALPWQRHHALDTHIPNFHTTAISRFPILSIQIFVIFGLFLFTFSNLIFFIPAGWPNFFTASLSDSDRQE